MQTPNKRRQNSNFILNQIEWVNKNKKAFTLVELIIVITILAILATVAFMSFKNYSWNARDGNRLATITQIQKWLEFFVLKTTKYPNPDEIYGTGIYEPTNTILNYVWYVWGNIGGLININKVPLDPVTGDNYVYAVSSNHQKYQLATTL
jgi:prepilin-type N-terminal cleavage/methylation domain-containing protein